MDRSLEACMFRQISPKMLLLDQRISTGEDFPILPQTLNWQNQNSLQGAPYLPLIFFQSIGSTDTPGVHKKERRTSAPSCSCSLELNSLTIWYFDCLRSDTESYTNRAAGLLSALS